VARPVVRAVRHVASVAVSHVVDAYHAAATYAVRAVKAVARTATRTFKAAVHVVRTAYHAVASAARKVVRAVAHAVTRTAKAVGHAVTRAARAVAHAVVKTAKAAASFVKKHAATIASIAAGVVVFAGCTALTAGAGAIACGALAGVVSSLVTAGAACADGQKGACSVGSFAKAAVIGGVTGAVGGAFGGGAAGDLADSVVGDVAAAGAADAVSGGAAEAAAAGAEDTAGSVVSQTAENAGERPAASVVRSEGEPAAPSCGGMSFAASTGVLLASGKTEAMSKLTPGQKVLATNTRTGKNQAEKVTAILVHYDRDLFDLKVRSLGRTSVIDTTSNHLFWVPGAGDRGRWVRAAALRHGTHLRTPSGTDAAVVDGWAPRHHDGWMWDLTVPGNNDHDFYVLTAAVSVLVHNCPAGGSQEGSGFGGFVRRIFGKSAGESVGPNATVGDLRGLEPGNELDPAKEASLARLGDDELLAAARQTELPDAMFKYPGENTLGNGNHRMAELLQRAANPNSSITYNSRIYIIGFGG
jgi:hypothetical protein